MKNTSPPFSTSKPIGTKLFDEARYILSASNSRKPLKSYKVIQINFGNGKNKILDGPIPAPPRVKGAPTGCRVPAVDVPTAYSPSGSYQVGFVFLP
jgi:hypothetical protein